MTCKQEVKALGKSVAPRNEALLLPSVSTAYVRVDLIQVFQKGGLSGLGIPSNKESVNQAGTRNQVIHHAY